MNKLKIGIIGAGRLGTVLARILLKAGYSVQLSHGENANTTKRVAGLLGDASVLIAKEDMAKIDLIVLVVRWEHIEEALVPLQHKLKGKILVDATNPFVNERLLFETADSICSSLIVSALAQGVIIVKAFNTLLADWLEKKPSETSGKRVVFISGDDTESKK